MQEDGWSRHRVRRALRAAHRSDHSFERGEILGSMCTLPHQAAAHAHALFLPTNLGDPDHFPGTRRLEAEVLDDVRALLHAPVRATGRFLTGGTEANLFAMYVAREKTGKRTVVLPEHAHFSFEKAARMLGMRLRWVPSGPGHRADPDAMANAIRRDTALVVAVAGSTELGLVDDIQAIAAACRRSKVLLHVDAAFGGYVLPFLPDERAAAPFDFTVPGVWSLSLDPHKMGMSAIPGGILVLRDGRDWKHVSVPTPYVSTGQQSQLLGTRPGAAAAAAWAVHRSLGRSGFRRVVAQCMANTQALVDGLAARSIPLVAPPELNVVTFAASDPVALQRRLEEKGLRVNVVPRFDGIRIVVNPHVDSKAVDRLLTALDEVGA